MADYNKTDWIGDPGANPTAMMPSMGPMPTFYTFLRPGVMGWILSVGSSLIISTNLLVAAALLQLLRRKGNQSWCFVLNLALADTLVGLAITGIATDTFNGKVTVEGVITLSQKTKCLLRMAFIIFPSVASILSMFLISLDRYVAIKLPLRYSQLTGKRTVAGALVFLWLVSLTVGFLPGMAQQLQQGDYQGLCTFFAVIRPGGIMVVFCACFFPILSVFIYFYLDILKIACGHQKQIRLARQVGSRLPQRSRYWCHVKALRTVALLVGCFTLSWCPFFVVCVVQVLCKACMLTKVLENDLWLLGLSNSLINPLVYACWQREVRMQISALFFCFKDRLRNSAPSVVVERCQTEWPVTTQTILSGDDPLDPTLPQITNEEAHAVPLSDSTSL